MALTLYRTCLPGSWRSQTLKGKCRALRTAAVILCLLPLLTADQSLQNPYSSRRLLRDAAAISGLFQTSGGLANLPVSLISSTLPCISCFCGCAPSLLCSQQRGRPWSPQRIAMASGAWRCVVAMRGAICCIPHTRGLRRCRRYLDIGLFHICDLCSVGPLIRCDECPHTKSKFKDRDTYTGRKKWILEDQRSPLHHQKVGTDRDQILPQNLQN